MERYRLVIRAEAQGAARLRLDSPSVMLALLVADINMTRGVAELWRGEKLLARLRKRTGPHQTLWELV